MMVVSVPSPLTTDQEKVQAGSGGVSEELNSEARSLHKSLVWTRHQFQSKHVPVLKTQMLGRSPRFRLRLGEKGESGLLMLFPGASL